MAHTLTVWKFPTAAGADATLDRVRKEFSGSNTELISTNLSHDEEARLRELFVD